MFNFFGSLLHKTIVSFVGLAALFGLISATPQNTTVIPTTSTPQIAVQQTSSTASSDVIVTPPPIKKISVAPSVSSVATPPSQPQTAIVPQRQPVVSTPPPNTTLCNGTYYQNCSTGQNFVCPAIGGGYCQTSQQQTNDEAEQEAALQQQEANAQVAQQQAQATAAQQQKTNQMNALTSAYNTQYDALQQQIINIKNQYYADLGSIGNTPGGSIQSAAGQAQNLADKDNAQIAQIQLQEQQLYLDYESRLNAL
jgi:hypothetical protein